jgi:hypothetical protein
MALTLQLVLPIPKRAQNRPSFRHEVSLVLSVSRRIRVTGWRHGVRVSDLAIAPVNDGLAAPRIRDDLFGAPLGARLRFVVRTRPLAARCTDVPSAVLVRDDMALIPFAHPVTPFEQTYVL